MQVTGTIYGTAGPVRASYDWDRAIISGKVDDEILLAYFFSVRPKNYVGSCLQNSWNNVIYSQDEAKKIGNCFHPQCHAEIGSDKVDISVSCVENESFFEKVSQR